MKGVKLGYKSLPLKALPFMAGVNEKDYNLSLFN